MLKLSPLPKTWIIDVDGTIVKHNGYLDGEDCLLDGVKEFFDNLSAEDTIILLTARESKYIDNLKKFLKNNGIRYNYLLSDLPLGERIIINDNKPSGLICSYAICKKRDEKLVVDYKIDEDL